MAIYIINKYIYIYIYISRVGQAYLMSRLQGLEGVWSWITEGLLMSQSYNDMTLTLQL